MRLDHKISTSNMRFSGLLFNFVAIAATLGTSSAFVPTKPSFVNNNVAKISLGNQNVEHAAMTTTAATNPSTSSSALSMGILENFVEGSDAKTRQKETDQYLAEVQTRVERINNLEPTIEDLGDDELQGKTEEFKQRLKNGEDINGPILEEAFAVVREAAW